MDASSFEFAVSMPRETRFAGAVHRLAVQAAQYAGCAACDVDAFARVVEAAFEGCVAASTSDHVSLSFRRSSGPLEVVVDGRVLTLTV